MSEFDWQNVYWLNDGALPNLEIVAKSISELNIDVLLTGETGSGKDTLARYLHELSNRKGPFVAMNCAAIPESLFESELFGVVSGAYTGADHSRMGYVESAQGGTLYLDEIDSMPLPLQAKLLRVLETRQFERLGSTTPIQLDICVVASAQRSLDDLVEQNQFRRDLYFRLNVLTLKLPALRQKREWILPLFERFALGAAQEMDTAPPLINQAIEQLLLNHDWPGNIRELKSAAKRHVLGINLLGAEADQPMDCDLKCQLRLIEKVLIQESLQRHKHCIDAVLHELDIPRRTLYHRMKELGV